MSPETSFEANSNTASVLDRAHDAFELNTLAAGELSEQEQDALHQLLAATPGSDLKTLALSVRDERFKQRALRLMAEQLAFEQATEEIVSGAQTVDELSTKLANVPGIQGNDMFYPGYLLAGIVPKFADNLKKYLDNNLDIMKFSVADFDDPEMKYHLGVGHTGSDQPLLPPTDFGLLAKVIELVNTEAQLADLAALDAEVNKRPLV